jgi:hypothetical protein
VSTKRNVKTYQVDDPSRASLVGGLFAEKQKTLAGMRRPSSILVCNIRLLPAKVAGKVLVLDWLRTKPEKLFLIDETPGCGNFVSSCFQVSVTV